MPLIEERSAALRAAAASASTLDTAAPRFCLAGCLVGDGGS